MKMVVIRNEADPKLKEPPKNENDSKKMQFQQAQTCAQMRPFNKGKQR